MVTEFESVTGLYVDSITTRTASLTWNSGAGALYYQVYFKVTGTVAYTFLGGTANTRYVVTTLEPGISYTFEVVPGDFDFYPSKAAQVIISTDVSRKFLENSNN